MVSGLGDISLLLRTVAFHYTSAGRRKFNLDGKNPVAVELEADFTASAILITGIKFPTGDTSRLKEEFHEVDIPVLPKAGFTGMILPLARDHMMESLVNRRRFDTGMFF